MTNQYLCAEDTTSNQIHLERYQTLNLELSSGTTQSTLTYPWKHERKDVDSLYWSNLDEAKIGEVIRMNNEDYTVIDTIDIDATVSLTPSNPYSVMLAVHGFDKNLNGKWMIHALHPYLELFHKLIHTVQGHSSKFEQKNALRTLLNSGNFRVRRSGL